MASGAVRALRWSRAGAKLRSQHDDRPKPKVVLTADCSYRACCIRLACGRSTSMKYLARRPMLVGIASYGAGRTGEERG